MRVRKIMEEFLEVKDTEGRTHFARASATHGTLCKSLQMLVLKSCQSLAVNVQALHREF